jgi:hypothetical protein
MTTQAEVQNYESRISKDGKSEFTILLLDGTWEVECWGKSEDPNAGEQYNDSRWMKTFKDESAARAEFTRFE